MIGHWLGLPQLKEEIGKTEWMQHAECKGQDAKIFFPSPDRRQFSHHRFCDLCPVRVECLDYAIDNDVTHGIWGGLTIEKIRYLQFKKRSGRK